MTRLEMRVGMSPGASSDGSSGSNRRPPAGSAAAAASRCSRSSGVARLGPRPHRLLKQPQTHHVAEVADPAVDPALVGEVRRTAGLGQDRRSSSTPTSPHVPHEMYANRSPVAGHPDDGRGRVVRADVGDDGVRRQAGRLGDGSA